jgi:myosin-crossreactive antigen
MEFLDFLQEQSRASVRGKRSRNEIMIQDHIPGAELDGVIGHQQFVVLFHRQLAATIEMIFDLLRTQKRLTIPSSYTAEEFRTAT